jgi:hypothetical protein
MIPHHQQHHQQLQQPQFNREDLQFDANQFQNQHLQMEFRPPNKQKERFDPRMNPATVHATNYLRKPQRSSY